MKHLKAGHYYPPFQPDVSLFAINAKVSANHGPIEYLAKSRLCKRCSGY